MKKCVQRLEASKGNPWSRPCQSMLYPADPVSTEYGTHLETSSDGQWCVACSEKTWEKACSENPKKTYMLLKTEQDKATCFLRCTRCGLHMCNICAVLYSERLLSLLKRKQDKKPMFCKAVEELLLAAKGQPKGFVVEIDAVACIVCQQTESLNDAKPVSTVSGLPPPGSLVTRPNPQAKIRKSRKKSRRLHDKYCEKRNQPPCRTLDGCLFFPGIGVLIHSDLSHFDSLSIAEQGCCSKKLKEGGLPHMNINPHNALELEHGGFFPEGNTQDIELIHQDFNVSYPSPEDISKEIQRRVELIVVDSHKAAALGGCRKEKGCNWINGMEMRKAFEYFTPVQTSAALERGIEVMALFVTPLNPTANMHALTLRWLCKPLSATRTPEESSQLYHYFTSLLSKGKGQMEISRVGGSNGIAHVSKEFFQMLHLPGITPRKSHAVMWYPTETKWLFFYISPYKKKHTLSCRVYSQPMPGGQVHISKSKLLDPLCPPFFKNIYKDFLLVKAESSPLVGALNKAIFPTKLNLRACEGANKVQEASNWIARICAKRSSNPDDFFLHLLTSCSVTVISYATRLHVDKAKRHPFLSYQGFWENKWVIDVPSEGIHDNRHPALGRGGAGRGKFVFAVLDHSYRLSDAYGWGDRNEQGNGALFRELIRVARENNIQGPDARDDDELAAFIAAIIEAGMENGVDHNLLAI